MNIGDLILRLLADGSQLEQDVTKEAQKAGDAGAKTMGARLSAGLKTNGLRAFSAVAAGVFAGMTKGALELEDVQARFQADTGASADEAAHAAKVINKAAGDNRLSLAEVADAAEKVHNDLGLVGDAADHATEKFAEYGRVTKQQAGAAVSDFDDILDAWNLTAADADGIMDKLVVSHQKYGGVVADSQKALASLAPALQAANLGVDDGIGLLNLFNAAGVDSAAAVTGMSKALGKVKSPEELQALIKDISDTQDPFLRAQKAADLFGAKAGPKLAQALAGNDLGDFTVSLNDAAGATDKAAEALDSGFGNRFKKLMSQAGAAVRGFGADFGPALTGAAALGSLANTISPKLGEAIGAKIIGGMKFPLGVAKKVGAKLMAAIGVGVAESAASSAVSTAVGDTIGEAVADGATKAGKGAAVKAAFQAIGLAGASAIGAGLAAGIAVLAVAKMIGDQLEGQKAELTAQVDSFVQTATLDGLKQARDGLQQQVDSQKFFGIDIELFNERSGPNSIDAQLARVQAEIDARTATVPAHVGDILAAGQSKVAAGAESMVGGVKPAVEGAAADAGAAGKKIPESVAAGVLSKQNEPVDAMDTLRNLMKNALTPAQEIARNIGILTSKELARGLHDKRAAVRAEARRVQAVAEEALADLIAKGGKVGKKAGEELSKGLHSKNARVRAEAQRVKNIVDRKLAETKGPAGEAGRKAGAAFAANLGRAISVNGVIHVLIRSDKNTQGKAVGGPIRAGTPYWVGERGPEIIVPKVDGTVLTAQESRSVVSGSAGTPLGASGDVINVPIHVTGVLRAETPADLAKPLRLLAGSGAISNPRKRRRVEVPTR